MLSLLLREQWSRKKTRKLFMNNDKKALSQMTMNFSRRKSRYENHRARWMRRASLTRLANPVDPWAWKCYWCLTWIWISSVEQVLDVTNLGNMQRSEGRLLLRIYCGAERDVDVDNDNKLESENFKDEILTLDLEMNKFWRVWWLITVRWQEGFGNWRFVVDKFEEVANLGVGLVITVESVGLCLFWGASYTISVCDMRSDFKSLTRQMLIHF
jgi:hypothetical protein